MEITNKEPILYRQVLYGDDSLIVVGDLLEYPDSYLCMTRTVYEEMGLEALGSGSDGRDDYVEMTQISVYRIAEQNQAELSHSQDYYQAGWYRTASMAEDGTLYTATDKNIYGAEGSTEYLTEVIPVVGSQTEMNYLDSSRIYVDRYSTELDSYAVISSLDLSQPANAWRQLPIWANRCRLSALQTMKSTWAVPLPENRVITAGCFALMGRISRW